MTARPCDAWTGNPEALGCPVSGNVTVDVYGSANCTGVPTATLANQLLFAGPVRSEEHTSELQ